MAPLAPNKPVMEPANFCFGIDETVTITVSGETGTVTGRSEYKQPSTNNYLIRYKSADGRAVEAWWPEEALSKSAPSPE